MLKQVLEQPAVFWHEPRAPRGVWTIALVPSQHSLPHWPPVSKTACETEAEPAYTVREHMRNLKCNINDKTAHLYNAIETALEDHVVCACGARAPG